MVLDKRTGLHKVPAHHLQTPQPTARPSYNSMDWEPTSGTEDHDVEKSVQKRKSQREASSTEPKTGLAGLGPVLNGDMVKAVKSSVKAAREAFRSPQPAADFAAAASAAAAAALSAPTPTPEPALKKSKKDISKRESHPTAPGPSTLKLEGSINEAAPMLGGGVTPARSVSPMALPQPLPSSHLNLALANSGLAPSGPPFFANQILPPPSTPVPFMTGMNPGPRRVVVPKRVNEVLPPPASAHVSPRSSSTQENSDAENIPPFGGPSAAQIWIDTDSEPQQEAGIGEFVAAYTEVLFCVDFANEREFLIEFRNYHEAAVSLGSLPCLGQKGSGCNRYEEASLRRDRERSQGNDDARLGVFTDADHVAVSDAANRSAAAEAFLAHAVIARVPVPLGAVEGQWELFCPQYAADHMDRYGAGERILTLQSVPSPLSAVDHRAIYKGQLYLSPRATLYSLDNFAVPPHASFRTTAVQTTVDKYEMDIVFLGNGYLVLRIDMGLMLTGKETRNENGQPVVMEFLGIHEAALVWKAEDD